MTITLEGNLACYSCFFYEINCNNIENNCRIIQLILAILYGIGVLVCLIRCYDYRKFDGLLKAQTTKYNKIFIEKKGYFLFLLSLI